MRQNLIWKPGSCRSSGCSKNKRSEQNFRRGRDHWIFQSENVANKWENLGRKRTSSMDHWSAWENHAVGIQKTIEYVDQDNQECPDILP